MQITAFFLFPGKDIHVRSSIVKNNRIRQVENETPVAFLATLTNHAENLGANQNIAFDDVITDIGGAYNSHGGLFIAPVSGIYVFSTSIMSSIQTDSHFAFKRNGILITRMFYPGSSIGGFDTTSVTIVLKLAKGDDVAVVNLDSDKDIFGDHYSTFTGFLLQEIYDDSGVVGK